MVSFLILDDLREDTLDSNFISVQLHRIWCVLIFVELRTTWIQKLTVVMKQLFQIHDTYNTALQYYPLVPKKIDRWDILYFVCISHDRQWHIWPESSLKDACNTISYKSLFLASSSMVYWELWSIITRYFCILF